MYGYDGDQALVRLAGHTGDLKICLGQACKVVKRPGGSGKLLVLPGIAGKGQVSDLCCKIGTGNLTQPTLASFARPV